MILPATSSQHSEHWSEAERSLKTELRQFFFRKLPPWLWALGIFIGSSIPADYLPEFVLLSPDKLLHVVVFLVFAILIYRAIIVQKRSAILSRYPLASTFIISFFYALFDEVHQYFVPGRILDPFDLLADITGAGLGILACWLWEKARRAPRGSVPREEQIRNEVG